MTEQQGAASAASGTSEECEAEMRRLTNGERGCANPADHEVRTEPASPSPFTGSEIADLHDYPSFIVQRLIATINEFTEDVINQFGYWSEATGGYGSGGLSTLEYAFELRGWEDPHPFEGRGCDEPGCTKEDTCGWPVKGNEFTPDGYRRTCGPHWIQYREVP